MATTPVLVPGQGGVSRGPGAAPMLFGDESPEHQGSFKAEKLPPGFLIPENWQLVGLERVAPGVNPERDNTPGSKGSTGRGVATGGNRIAPRHRQVIRDFHGKKGLQQR